MTGFFVYDDLNGLNFNSNPTSKRNSHPDGYLTIDDNILSSAGISHYYGKDIPNGIGNGLLPNVQYPVLRTPEELEKSASSFNGLPLLLNHHETDAQKIDSLPRIGNAGSNVSYQNKDLMGTIYVHSDKAVKLITTDNVDERIDGLSCAYSYKPVFEEGDYEGQKYVVRMTDIVGNHIALVKKPRVERAKVADSADNNVIGIKQMTKEFLKSLFKASGISKTQDAGDSFNSMDMRTMMRAIEGSDMSEDDKSDQIDKLAKRYADCNFNMNLEADKSTMKAATGAQDADEDMDDKKDKSDDKKTTAKDDDKDGGSQIVDTDMLSKVVRDEVRKAIAELHEVASKGDEDDKKAMDSALETYKEIYGTPNVSAFNNDAKNVYKAILNAKGIACDSMDLPQLKVAVDVAKQMTPTKQYAMDSVSTKASNSIFDEFKHREV